MVLLYKILKNIYYFIYVPTIINSCDYKYIFWL